MSHTVAKLVRLPRSVSLTRVGSFIICSMLILGPVARSMASTLAGSPRAVTRERKQIALPTDRSHYGTFKRGESGVPLLMDLLKEFEPDVQKLLVRMAIAAGVQGQVSEAAQVDLQKLQEFAAANGLTRD